MRDTHDIVPDDVDAEELRSRQSISVRKPETTCRRCYNCRHAALEIRTDGWNTVEHDYYCSYCATKQTKDETIIGTLEE
jgi:hypothetical protein